jgi:hypothetical protein
MLEKNGVDWRTFVIALFGMMGLAFAGSRVAAQAPPPELALVPQDSFGFLHIRPADLWKGEVGAALRQQFADESAKINRATEPFLGAPFDEIESVTFAAKSVESIGGFTTRRIERRAPVFKDKDFDLKDKGGFDKKEPDFKDKKDVDFEEKKDFGVKDKKDAGDKEDEFWRTEGAYLLREAGMKIVTTLKPYDRARVKKAILGPGPAHTWKHKGDGQEFWVTRQSFPFALHFGNERTFIVASPPVYLMKALDDPAAKKFQGPLAAALAWAAAKRPIVIGINANEKSALDMKKELAVRWRQPWREDPVWTMLPLLDVHTAALAIDVAKETRAEGLVTFSNAQRAAAVEASVHDALALFRLFALGRLSYQMSDSSLDAADPKDLLFGAALVQQVAKSLRNAAVKRQDATFLLETKAEFDIHALNARAKADAEALAKDVFAQIARKRRISEYNLKQIMLAMMSFHDANKHLSPAAVYGKDGKPLLSWRVLLLPYLDEGPLYNEFKLDEAWDSPHNVKLLPRLPKVYAPIGPVKAKQPHATYYQVLTGEDTAFPRWLNKDRMFGATGPTMVGITDGTSNTFGVVEAFEPVPWTKPADLDYDAKKPLPKMGGALIESGFHVGMLDGTVRFVSIRVGEKTLRPFITRAGNETTDWDSLERP